ncbi:MAG TPA: PIN domain-containing protein [Rhizomicrobium sp.]|nr:PIN domain-containing protein [Rhizomicrobium sp.]
MRAAIVDTGPLVALLDRGQRVHAWAVARFEELEPPALVCEPVLAESMYLLGRLTPAQDALFRLLDSGAIRIAFRLDEHIAPVRALCRKYRDQPMSLADACIVRMSELYERHGVLTLDSDFFVYRRHGRSPLPLIHPAA